MSIAKINGADGKTGRYYTASVASGVEDYYAGRGEANGRWVGSGAGVFELSGEVDHEQFHHMLNGIDPRTGRPVRVAPRDAGTGELVEGVVRGFDLTFSAPKSVSVLYAAGDGRVAGEVRDAVDHATEEALRWLERRACVVRRGHGGAVELPGHGFVGAAFRHRTSRAGDPQLHTHVVISNMARGDDGRWTALDAKHVYAHSRTAGFVFQAVMRDELSRRLGVRWRESPTPGVFEIDGVPFELMRELSKRREQIEHALAEIGMSGPGAAQVATLATRPSKDHALDQAPELHDGWRAVCGEHGFGRTEVGQILGHARERGLDETALALTIERLLSSEGLTEREAVFSDQAVVRGWAQAAVDGASVEQLDTLTQRLLSRTEVVTIPERESLGELLDRDEQGTSEGRDVVGGAQLALWDGACVHGGREGGEQPSRVEAHEVFRGSARYTTTGMLAIERELLDRAQAGVGAGTGLCWEATVERVLAGAPSASREQAAMVRALATRGDRVAMVRAPAGTGKTWTLNLARQAWQHDRYPVLGVALSRRTVSELGEQAQLDHATSIAKLLLQTEQHGGLPHRSILIVDEAGMVGTRTLRQLLGLVEQADGKLVLVGDEYQLPEIHAGGGFRALAERLDAIELRDNFRQQDPHERDRVMALRHGAIQTWLHTGLRTSRIVLGDDAQHTRQLLLHDWLEDRAISSPGEAVMIARTNADVAWLNDAARHQLKSTGDLHGPELTVSGRSFQVGDVVIARRNLPGGVIDNGTRGHVVAIDHERRQLTVRTFGEQPREILLASSYLEERHLHHGYAITRHLAQGMTVDRVRALGGEQAPERELTYSANTRHRISATFYLTAPDHDRLPTPDRDPLDAITAALGKQAAKQLALDTIADPAAHHETPTVELYARRDALRELLQTYSGRAEEQRAFHTDRLTAAEQQLRAAHERVTQRREQLASARRRDRPEIETALARDERAIAAWSTERETHRTALQQLPDQLDPDRWLERNAPAVRELAAIETTLQHRDTGELRAELAAALNQPDPQLHALLGDRPLDPHAAQTWDHAITAIVTYRHHTPASEQPDLLGPEPHDHDHHARWQAARHALDTYHRGLRHDGPEIER